mmetsp:Transcript_14419/g.34767  ORF Transcript_14419/g.34767 Transcript_14419/m.34767 type:complete len:532 (-) Transcript_14419:295-1890(-)
MSTEIDNHVYVSDNDGGDNIDIASYWNDLPKLTKEGLFRTTPTKADDPQNCGNKSTYLFIVESIRRFLEDTSYGWNLWKTQRSSCILAADFLLTREDQKSAHLMIFYVAFLEECLARGFDAVIALLFAAPPLEGRIALGDLFPKFAFLHRAVEEPRAFLGEILARNATMSNHCTSRVVEAMLKRVSTTPMHRFHHGAFDTYGVVPEKTMVIKCKCEGQEMKEMAVYQDTSVNWIFNYTFASTNGMHTLLTGAGRINTKYFQCPFLRNLDNNGSAFYLITSGKKTVHDINLLPGSSIEACSCMKVVHSGSASPKVDNSRRVVTSKKKKSKKSNNGNRSKKKKRAQPRRISYSKHELDLDATRELHSKAMEPVFYEMRPRLKVIRQKHHALSLKNDSPKERSNKIMKEKEASSHDRACKNIIVREESFFGGKAGKKVYPILVGEATNLFKTPQLRLRNAAITLDLHGCSGFKAVDILRKGLLEWVDDAMKGEYPFVIAVDVICGGGNQVLSEIVAQFIRDSPQVANRPKGTIG